MAGAKRQRKEKACKNRTKEGRGTSRWLLFKPSWLAQIYIGQAQDEETNL